MVNIKSEREKIFLFLIEIFPIYKEKVNYAVFKPINEIIDYIINKLKNTELPLEIIIQSEINDDFILANAGAMLVR